MYNDNAYEEASRDLGSSGWQTLCQVVLQVVFPSLVEVALFSFTLSFDEIARTSGCWYPQYPAARAAGIAVAWPLETSRGV